MWFSKKVQNRYNLIVEEQIELEKLLTELPALELTIWFL